MARRRPRPAPAMPAELAEPPDAHPDDDPDVWARWIAARREWFDDHSGGPDLIDDLIIRRARRRERIDPDWTPPGRS